MLHVITAFQLGGAERVAIDLAVQHARWGLHPAVIAVRNPRKADDPIGQNFRELLQENRIPFTAIGDSDFRRDLVKLPFRLAKAIDRYSPDLVHSHTDVPDFVVSGARRLRSFRTVRTIHSTSLWGTHWVGGFLTEQGLRDDLIIGVSDASLTSYRNLRQRYGLSPSSFQHVIRSGVRIRPAEEIQQLKRLHRRDNNLRIAFFGRWDTHKGLDVLIKAFSTWRGDPLPVELSIFSDAVYDECFMRQVTSLPCTLYLSPPVPNASDLMAQFDLVIVPSRVEGLGLVALEALAAQTPVVASQISGLREVLPPNWPLLFPVDDAEALRNMILAVLHGQYDLGKLGEVGYTHASQYSIDAFSRKYLDCYLDYLAADKNG